MAVLRQRHSCRERRRFVRPVPELCLLQGVYPDEAQVCRAGLPASSHPAKPSEASFSGEGYRWRRSSTAGCSSLGPRTRSSAGCIWVRRPRIRLLACVVCAARSSSKPQAWRVRRFARQPVSACVAREAGYGQLRQ